MEHGMATAEQFLFGQQLLMNLQAAAQTKLFEVGVVCYELIGH